MVENEIIPLYIYGKVYEYKMIYKYIKVFSIKIITYIPPYF